MIYKAGLYFNYQSFKDTIILVIDNDKIPNKIFSNNGFVALFNGTELIGINIFKSSRFLKIKIQGLLETVNQPLKDLLYQLIKTYLNLEIEVISSPLFLAKVIATKNNEYLVSIGKQEVLASSLEPLEIGNYVLVTSKDSFLFDGSRAYQHLKNNENYLIVGKEVAYFDDSFLGTSKLLIKEND